MKFVRVDKLLDGVAPLRDRLARDLGDGKHVLWLLSGGSLIETIVEVMQQLDDQLTTGLTLMLMDERYGQVDHPDSNDRKMDEAGLQPRQARRVRVLQEGLSLEDTGKLFAKEASAAFQQADVVVGLFGMGANGHIAGVQPGSPAVASADFAVSFVWTDFQRITLTPKALAEVNVGYLFAAGPEKMVQLRDLRDRDLSLDEQPAQLLKQLPEAYIFNDQIGETA